MPPRPPLGEQPLLEVGELVAESRRARALPSFLPPSKPGFPCGSYDARSTGPRGTVSALGEGRGVAMAAVCRTAQPASGALPGQRHQPADRPEVLLAVAALQQLRREQLVEGARRWRPPAGRGRTSGRRAPPAAARRPGRRRSGRPPGRPRARRRAGRRTRRGAPGRGAGTGRRSGRGSRRRPRRSPRARRRGPARSGPRAGRGAGSPRRRCARTRSAPTSPWISRRKSSVAKRPSPSLPGSVFEVAASRTPASRSRVSSVETSTVSPGSSSSNSSTHTRRVRRQRGDRVVEAERADQVGQLDEGARTAWGPARRATARRAGGSCRRRSRRRGRPRRARLGLATLRRTGRFFGAAPHRPGERPEHVDGLGLGRLRRVGAVGVEAHVGEPRRRHQLGDAAGPRAREGRAR